MARGGRREGAGRKPRPAGERRLTFSWDKVAQAIELSPEKTPLAHLLAFMQNEDMKDTLRLQAAIAAAPYMHPKLSSVEIKTDQTAPMKAQSEIGAALSALAELMRQRKTIDADVVDVDERHTGRGDKVARIVSAKTSPVVSDILSYDTVAQSGDPEPVSLQDAEDTGGANGKAE